jgi:hypothetical protein
VEHQSGHGGALERAAWQSAPFELADWMRSYAIGRYGTADAHALAAWSALATTA